MIIDDVFHLIHFPVSINWQVSVFDPSPHGRSLGSR